MSKRLNEVRQQHAATVKEMRTLHEKAVREDRAFSPAEQSLYDTLSWTYPHLADSFGFDSQAPPGD